MTSEAEEWSFRGMQHGWCGALKVLQCSQGEGGQITWKQMVRAENSWYILGESSPSWCHRGELALAL